jgi:hypothetical protein
MLLNKTLRTKVATKVVVRLRAANDEICQEKCFKTKIYRTKVVRTNAFNAKVTL